MTPRDGYTREWVECLHALEPQSLSAGLTPESSDSAAALSESNKYRVNCLLRTKTLAKLLGPDTP